MKAVQPVVLHVNETDGIKTMSSLDMVAYINATREAGKPTLRHDHFMVKAGIVLGETLAPKFLGSNIYLNGKGGTQARAVYNFPQREAMLMAMSYSYKLQATVYDAWQAAEAKVAPVVQLPQTYAEALRKLADSTELAEKQVLQIAQQAQQITADAPAVAFVEKYVSAGGRSTFREVAKMLNAPEREFRNFLIDHKYMYKLNGEYVPYGVHLTAKRFEVKMQVVDDVARTSLYFTPLGVTYVSEKWKTRVPMLRKPLTVRK